MIRFLKHAILIIVLTGVSIASAWPQVPQSGYFIATDKCEAFHSLKKGTNPGNIRLTQDMAYALLAKNKVEATHFRIRVKDADPGERWVSSGCGFILTDCRKSETSAGASVGPPSSNNGSAGPEYLLALSWQAAFCQTHRSKTECETQHPARYDATHFTLHGLWPQPRSNVYCGTSNVEKSLDKRKMWDQLPLLDISPATHEDLIEVMPGVASYLHRHEWIKHGTCYSPTPEEYFAESILLTEQINASPVRELFAGNIGKAVSAADIMARFDEAFGPGAGKKVRVKCSNGIITELWINLKGEVSAQSRVADLLQHADDAASGCRQGIVDPVGY